MSRDTRWLLRELERERKGLPPTKAPPVFDRGSCLFIAGVLLVLGVVSIVSVIV